MLPFFVKLAREIQKLRFLLLVENTKQDASMSPSTAVFLLAIVFRMQCRSWTFFITKLSCTDLGYAHETQL